MSELSRDELWKQLDNVVSLRSSQDSVLWQAFSLFLASNGVLLVALFTTGKFPDREVGQIVSAVGVLASVVWGLVQRRALAHITAYETLLKRIEGSLFRERDRKHSIQEVWKEVRHPPRARHVMTMTVFGALFGWVLGFLLSTFPSIAVMLSWL